MTAAHVVALEQSVSNILAANTSKQPCRRNWFKPEERADMGHYASLHGNRAAVSHFDLSESTIRGIKVKYMETTSSEQAHNLQLFQTEKRKEMHAWRNHGQRNSYSYTFGTTKRGCYKSSNHYSHG